MKRCLTAVLAGVLLLSGCGADRSEIKAEIMEEVSESAYQEGYKDGYSDGLFVADYDEDAPYTGEYLVWSETPGSSCFSYVGYDSKYEKLAVIFRDNSTHTYVYSEFSMKDYRAFMDADSLGTYYNKNIKGNYPAERIDSPSGTYFEPW